MERYVFVQSGDNFEKRDVKVGVSDFFFAEIQDGLKAGDIVSLELPKEEREKKTSQLAVKKPANENGSSVKVGMAGSTNTSEPAPASGGSDAPKRKANDGRRSARLEPVSTATR